MGGGAIMTKECSFNRFSTNFQDEIVADYKKINTYDGPLRKMEPDIPETIPE